MYSPFYQLRKPAVQQNAIEDVQQFPAHLVPGKLTCSKFYLGNRVSTASTLTMHTSGFCYLIVFDYR